MELSIIIPAYNERESLPELIAEIHKACSPSIKEYEILIIDDGSTDATFDWLKQAAPSDPKLKAARFRYNCGKAAALALGFEKSNGQYVVTLDADLQDNPAEIPAILEMLKTEADMVSGWKKKRFDPFHKTWPSKLFNLVTRLVSGLKIHDFNCGLKGYRREVAKSLNLYGELHRFIPVIAHWNGFRIAEKTIRHRTRKHGYSKYGIARLSHGLLDLVTLLFLHRYTQRPLHLFGLLGIIISLSGIGILSYFGLMWIIHGALHIRPLLLGGIAAILLGFQIISLGLLAEMIAQRSTPQYPISDSIGGIC